MTNLELLKLLLPFGVYSDSADSVTAKDLAVHAGGVDACQSNADALFVEISPDTTDSLLAEWERVYGLDSESPIYQRLQSLIAAINARNGYSIPHIQAALRPFVGYDVDIEDYAYFWSEESDTSDDGSDVDYYAGDEDTVFTFTVAIDQELVTTDGFDAVAIQTMIDKIRPAHANGLLDLGGDGFYSEDDDSLSDLTLTSDT